MLKIGDFSKLSRVSIRMLRHYDEIGLLKPSETDPFTGYRYYSEEQLPLAGRIAELKAMGFGLSEIGEMVDSCEDPGVLEQFFSGKKAELQILLEETKQRIRLLETARERLREDRNAMKYNVSLKSFPERYAACVRGILPCYDQEGMLWSLLVSETASMDLVPDDPCYCCAVYYDMEYKESDADVEIQKTVKGQYEDTEHVKFKTLPAVTAASATFRGSYDQMNDVNGAVARWIRDNGYELDGPAFFIYHVSPHETSRPEEFVTEICYPVKMK